MTMRVTLWGTRGSLASPGPDTERYGGNTSCVEVRADDDTVLVLDAGTGLRRLGAALPRHLKRVDLLLTHMHMDHIQGLGFFAPLFVPGMEVHIWGPCSATLGLGERLARYLSPPLFPIHLSELPCNLSLHEMPCERFHVGPFRVSAALVCHPGTTVGYRISTGGQVVTYLPDHEPALGVPGFPKHPEWTSGYTLAEGADLLIHDAQYSAADYESHVGWGHSSWEHAFAFASMSGVKRLAPFHHNPTYCDEDLDRLLAESVATLKPNFAVMPSEEGRSFVLD